MLYWFRTPPGVKVGRAALDEDAIRLIEQLNPGIEFDWTRILKGQGAPPTESRPPAEVRRQRPDNRRPQPTHAPAPQRSGQPVVAAVPLEVQPAEVPSGTAAPEATGQFAAADSVPDPTTDAPARADSDVPTPAHGRIGAEGVQRLRARYAEILVRISERASDAARREELKAQADRLNPDAWVTDAEVVQGLEQYESVFASLREVVGQKRRRRRRGRGPRPAQPGGASPDASAGQTTGDSNDSFEGPEEMDGPEGDAGNGHGGGDLPPGEG